VLQSETPCALAAAALLFFLSYSLEILKALSAYASATVALVGTFSFCTLCGEGILSFFLSCGLKS
jgi:hypothetical protein